MIQFLVKRFIGLLFVVIAVTFITFILGYFAPGDPIRDLLGNHYSAVLYASYRHQYGLDLPWYQQYFNFIAGLFRFDFARRAFRQTSLIVDPPDGARQPTVRAAVVLRFDDAENCEDSE